MGKKSDRLALMESDLNAALRKIENLENAIRILIRVLDENDIIVPNYDKGRPVI